MDWDELEAAVLAAPDEEALNGAALGAGGGCDALMPLPSGLPAQPAMPAAPAHPAAMAQAMLLHMPVSLGIPTFGAGSGGAGGGSGVGGGGMGGLPPQLPQLPQLPLLPTAAPLPVLRCLNAAHAPGCMRCVARRASGWREREWPVCLRRELATLRGADSVHAAPLRHSRAQLRAAARRRRGRRLRGTRTRTMHNAHAIVHRGFVH
jgi:hypothetical protein